MDLIAKTAEFVQRELEGAEAGHDWFHIERVWRITKHIAREEGADMLICELGALLHDIADAKFHDGDEELGPQRSADFLRSQGCDEQTINAVDLIIRHISFKGGHDQTEHRTKELDVVQDADRLDAIGAIGIARTFNYGGFRNRPLYDPAVPPATTMTKDEYRKSTAPTINHFYEKLLLLRDRMNTNTGRRLANDRHRFMENFLEQFYKEWNGEV